MKTKQKLNICLGILAVLLVCVIAYAPMRANAATLKNITAGQSFALKHEEQEVYKLVIDTDAVVKFAWSNDERNYSYIGLFTDKACKDRICSCAPSTKSGNKVWALKKGTYFVQAYDGYSFSSYTPTMKLKVTWEDASVINKNNYCRAKAIAVNASTNVRVAQTPTQDYTRWYKIKVPKTQKLTINAPTGTGTLSNLTVLSTSMTRFNNFTSSGTGSSAKMVSVDKMAADTYFILVSGCGYSYTKNRLGEYHVFSWQ